MAERDEYAELLRAIRERRGTTRIAEWRLAHPFEQLRLREVDLIGADLRGADLRGADLRGARLGGADMRGAYLAHADAGSAYLNGADLREARLYVTELRHAELRRVQLHNAELNGAHLVEVDLREAQLIEADLKGTQFVRADLRGTDLRNAKCDASVFADVDLSSAIGLESVRHAGPSTVGLDTLFKSKGKIPQVFLRGAGVPESLIESLQSLTRSALEFYSCFISYSHTDSAFAHRLHNALQRSGIRCWLDEHQLLPGDSIRDQITEGIKVWDKVLFCVSHSSLTSWWVDKELTSAFAKEEQLSKQAGRKVHALVPLNLDGSLFTWDSGWGDEVRSRLAADFTDWEHDNAKFEAQFERVVKALRSDEGVREKPPAPKLGK